MPDAGESCDQLAAEYTAELARALACTPDAPDQCQVLVASFPTICPNIVCDSQEFVNDGTGVEAVRGRWLRACGPSPHSCPAIACAHPHPASICVASDATVSNAGTCVPSVTTDAGS